MTFLKYVLIFAQISQRTCVCVYVCVSARPDRPWGPTILLYNGYRVFPGGKVRPGRAADHSPPSSATVMEE